MVGLDRLANVYGFGSYFKGASNFNDVDILIVHNSTSFESCKVAISLKKKLLARIDRVSVTMLSKSEESEVNFIEKASAKHLSLYNGKNLGEIISAIENNS
ncbi:hypothetical protein BCS84_10890 [Vibrio cyclitrophicus]|nr:hypothetical protein [Vibrio cyclitrophicus]OED89779.1 hypothetical protein OAQ_18865 [Vibrio cyclitrophicus ZF30]OEE14447.1 hypothetical protein OC1_13460 [Vibrio cyclitrophicus ZF207]PMJ26189.1 hypothetical protein BCU25_21285 [Vibrio cyclitrophicus]PMP55448.1 hypothetical protein BCS84_12295 [Vibrio cyclitrophicus]